MATAPSVPMEGRDKAFDEYRGKRVRVPGYTAGVPNSRRLAITLSSFGKKKERKRSRGSR